MYIHSMQTHTPMGRAENRGDMYDAWQYLKWSEFGSDTVPSALSTTGLHGISNSTLPSETHADLTYEWDSKHMHAQQHLAVLVCRCAILAWRGQERAGVAIASKTLNACPSCNATMLKIVLSLSQVAYS